MYGCKKKATYCNALLFLKHSTATKVLFPIFQLSRNFRICKVCTKRRGHYKFPFYANFANNVPLSFYYTIVGWPTVSFAKTAIHIVLQSELGNKCQHSLMNLALFGNQAHKEFLGD